MYSTKTFVITIVLALLLAAVLGFSAAYIINTQGQTNTSKTTELNYVGYTYSYQQIEPLIKEYEKQNPNVFISYTQIDKDSYKDYLLQRFHSTNTAIIPDIFENESTMQNTFLRYSHLAPNDIIDTTTFINTFQPLYQRGLIYQNKYVLGVPEDQDPLILLYNKSLLSQLGFNISQFNTDTNTFNNSIASLAQKDQSISAINIGSPSRITVAGDILQLFMMENQTKMNTSDGYSADFNSQNGIGSLRYYNSFINGDFQDNWNNISGGNDVSNFAKETISMIFAKASEIPEIKQLNPSINIGYAIYPSLQTPLDLATYNYLTVYTKSPNVNAAWKFLMYLESQPSLSSFSNSLTTSNTYGLIYPRKDMAVTTPNTELNNTLNTAAKISKDWNYENYSSTEKIFDSLISNYLAGYDVQSSLGLAVSQINKNIQNSFSL